MDDRTGLLIGSKRRAALVGTVFDGTVAQCRRHQSTNVLHQEELRLEVLHEPEKLPEERSSWVLDSRSLAGSTESLAGWPAYQQIKFTRYKMQVLHNLLSRQFGDVLLVNSEVGIAETTRISVAADRFTEGRDLLDTGQYLERSRFFQADVQPHAT